MKNQTAHLLPPIADVLTEIDAIRNVRSMKDELVRQRAQARLEVPEKERDHAKLLMKKKLGENISNAEIEASRKAIEDKKALLTDDAVAADNEIIEDRTAKLDEAMNALSSAFTPLRDDLRSQIALEADELIFKLQSLYSRYEALSVGGGQALDIRMPTLGDVRRPPLASKSEAEIDPTLREALDVFERAMRVIGRL